VSKKIKMARLVKKSDQDRSFDREFWQKLGAEKRFAAAWQMVQEWLMINGQYGTQSRLQRSVQNIKRRTG